MIDLEYRWRHAARNPGGSLPPSLEEYAARFLELQTPDPELIAEEYWCDIFWEIGPVTRNTCAASPPRRNG